MVTLLVGTGDGLVELGTDGSTTATYLEGRDVGAIVEDDSGWWALVDGTEVWHAGAERTGWQPRARAPDGTRLTCLLPRPGGLLVGTSGAHLLRLDEHGVLGPVGAFDQLDRRAEWYTPWGGPPDTRWLAGGVAGTVFAGVHVGGIVSSPDGGRSWHQTGLDIHADVHQVVTVADHPDLVLAACAEGLAVSDDQGGTWRIDDHGLHATYARAIAVTGDRAILSASVGPDGRQSALYRRPLTGDGPLERCRAGLPEWFDDNIDTGCLAAAGDVVAAAAPGGDVWRSDDRGSTWRHLTTTSAPAGSLAPARY